MYLKCGAIIPFQFKNKKKLVVVGTGNGPLTIDDVKRSVALEFNIQNYEFYNKKIGFHIPKELFLQYLEQRRELSNFIIEIVEENDSAEEEKNDKSPMSVESELIHSATKRSQSLVNVEAPRTKKSKQNSNNINIHLCGILKTYKTLCGENELNEATRESMIKQVARYELSKVLETDSPLLVSNERFLELTSAIVNMFPSENPETYYISELKNPKRIAGGMLYESFNSQRCCYLEKNGKSRYSNSDYKEQLVEADFRDLNNILEFMNDWPVYFKAWQQSFQLRMTYIDQIDKPFAYFEKFIESVNEKVSDLVEYDFEKLHPGKGEKLFENWEQMTEVIFTEAIASGQDDVPLIMDMYGNSQLSGFMMLSYFLENYDCNVKGFRKDDPCNLVVHLDTVNEKPLSIFQEYCRFHNQEDPIVFVTGNNTNELTSYVFVAGSLYWMETVLKAVDFCFKCYHVLRLPYSNRQARVWQVIQGTFYDIHINEDSNLRKFLNIFRT